jgi:hypothetical protein
MFPEQDLLFPSRRRSEAVVLPKYFSGRSVATTLSSTTKILIKDGEYSRIKKRITYILVRRQREDNVQNCILGCTAV